MKIKPISDNVLVKPAFLGEKSEGGIYIPTVARDGEKPQQGEVIAVGKGKIAEDGKRVPIEVKVGDTVIFTKYSPNEIKVNDERYYMIKAEDILGLLE